MLVIQIILKSSVFLIVQGSFGTPPTRVCYSVLSDLGSWIFVFLDKMIWICWWITLVLLFAVHQCMLSDQKCLVYLSSKCNNFLRLWNDFFVEVTRAAWMGNILTAGCLHFRKKKRLSCACCGVVGGCQGVMQLLVCFLLPFIVFDVLYVCALINVYMWLKKIKSVHHLKQSSVFRRLKIHMDSFT